LKLKLHIGRVPGIGRKVGGRGKKKGVIEGLAVTFLKGGRERRENNNNVCIKKKKGGKRVKKKK